MGGLAEDAVRRESISQQKWSLDSSAHIVSFLLYNTLFKDIEEIILYI